MFLILNKKNITKFCNKMKHYETYQTIHPILNFKVLVVRNKHEIIVKIQLLKYSEANMVDTRYKLN
jgi:hypothetical protein